MGGYLSPGRLIEAEYTLAAIPSPLSASPRPCLPTLQAAIAGEKSLKRALAEIDRAQASAFNRSANRFGAISA
jgi:hypothetical protein